MRTIVDLTAEQIAQLRLLCARKGISRAEAVRRGVELLLEHEEAQTSARLSERRRALDAVFGMWKDRGLDGVEYQRALRAEWDRDLWNS